MDYRNYFFKVRRCFKNTNSLTFSFLPLQDRRVNLCKPMFEGSRALSFFNTRLFLINLLRNVDIADSFDPMFSFSNLFNHIYTLQIYN